MDDRQSASVQFKDDPSLTLFSWATILETILDDINFSNRLVSTFKPRCGKVQLIAAPVPIKLNF
jgi:hypothetical protein